MKTAIVILLLSHFLASALEMSQFNDELVSEIKTNHSASAFTNSSTFKRLIAQRDVALFKEMCFTRKRPVLVAAGLLGIEEVEPKLQFSMALRVLWNTEPSDKSFLMGILAIQSKRIPSTAEFNEAFNVVMQYPPKDFDLATIFVLNLKTSQIVDWLKGPRFGALPSNEALAIECVLEAGNAEFPKELQKKLLESYRELSGYAKVVYLMRYPEESDTFTQKIIETIENPNTGDQDLEDIIHYRANLIGRLIKERKLKMSPEREETIVKWLRFYARV